MKIRNVDFDFSILRARDAERYDAALNNMQRARQGSESDNSVQALRRECDAMDGFLFDILGDDYDEQLGIDPEDLGDLLDVFMELMESIQNDYETFSVKQAQMKQQAARFNQFQARGGAASSNATVLPSENQAAISMQPPAKLNRAQRRAAMRALRDSNA